MNTIWHFGQAFPHHVFVIIPSNIMLMNIQHLSILVKYAICIYKLKSKETKFITTTNNIHITIFKMLYNLPKTRPNTTSIIFTSNQILLHKRKYWCIIIALTTEINLSVSCIMIMKNALLLTSDWLASSLYQSYRLFY